MTTCAIPGLYPEWMVIEQLAVAAVLLLVAVVLTSPGVATVYAHRSAAPGRRTLRAPRRRPGVRSDAPRSVPAVVADERPQLEGNEISVLRPRSPSVCDGSRSSALVTR